MEYKSPVYGIIAVPIEKIESNDYNPNAVAPPEMQLLYKSIKEDELLKDAKLTEAIKSEPDDREEESPKKGFWSRLFGN